MRDPRVFELLCLEAPHDSPEIFLSLKTRLVGSQVQIFPGKELQYFNLSRDKGTVPSRLSCDSSDASFRQTPQSWGYSPFVHT